MKIKNLLFILFTILFIITSCEKEGNPIEQNPEVNLLELMPNSFTKKVLIEEFTAEYCHPCADVYEELKPVLDENPTKVYLTTIHTSDFYSTDQTDQLFEDFEVSGIPAAMVDRYTFNSQNKPITSPHPTNIRNISNIRLGDNITTGLQIETEILDNEKANITVYVGRNEILSGSPSLTTYLLEDKIYSLNQVGAFNDPEYMHHHVLRKVLTDVNGDLLNFSEKDRDLDIFKYENIDISNFEKENLEVVAFIHYHNNTDLTNHEIINVQKVKLGENQKWD